MLFVHTISFYIFKNYIIASGSVYDTDVEELKPDVCVESSVHLVVLRSNS